MITTETLRISNQARLNGLRMRAQARIAARRAALTQTLAENFFRKMSV